MDTMMIVVLIIVVLFFLCVIGYILTYNKIQKNVIRIYQAESEIDEALRKKYDYLVQLEGIINENTDLKQDNFKDFTSEEVKLSSFDADRKLAKIDDTFKKIKLDYEKELNTDAYRSILTSLKINDEKLDASKIYYNKFTTKLNLVIKKFPSNIIARIHGVKEHLYFDKKNMSDDDIFDFKF